MREGEAKRRWSATGEQVRILERVYREGTHRPTTMEIHHITDLLSRHGSVQGINVFYWFKNRKAREKRSMPTMPASALTGKWGGLKLNTDGSGRDLIQCTPQVDNCDSDSPVVQHWTVRIDTASIIIIRVFCKVQTQIFNQQS
ncbi:WUSCHEL-related homeobox 6-like [Cryptomeria japonica]|uniref:WUSCHEL-related homeobox 6-like n=1 Tax=Cryptomeria japonica TaxID=3369 RepID=UPI0027DA42AE|nr:WUSCHEL-related homeobox 6-like [Cryptomeria japonica]